MSRATLNDAQYAMLAYYDNPTGETLAALKRFKGVAQTRQALTRRGLLESCDAFPFTVPTQDGRVALAARNATT